MQTSLLQSGPGTRAAQAKVLRQENNVWVPDGAARTPKCLEEREQWGEEEEVRSESGAWTDGVSPGKSGFCSQ